MQGRKNLNRAVKEDIVAIEILPRDQWRCPSSLLVEDVEDPDAFNPRSVMMYIVIQRTEATLMMSSYEYG